MEDITSIIDDRLEARFEAYAQAQIKVHEEAHKKLLEAVTVQIQTTVNGKIDKIQKTLDALDTRIQPFEYTRTWFASFKEGVVWIAGVITPLGVILFVVMKAISFFKE